MRPTFIQALRYFAEVTCISPLRTGHADDDGEQLLYRPDGTPFLQGASLAGALRSWKEDAELFGDGDAESAVIVSDVVFRYADKVRRKRVSIDPGSGTGRGLFQTDALPAGTTGEFWIVWRGMDGMEDAAAAIESYLSALHNGSIALGGQKNNGFGRVTLSVRKRTYQLDREEDRNAWLEGDAVQAEPILLSAGPANYAEFRVTAETDNLLVKAASGEGVGKESVHAVPVKEGDEIVVAGSSLKGAVRAQIGRILPHLYPEKDRTAEVQRLFGRGSGQENGTVGRIRFSDGVIENAKTVSRTRNRISRFSGGTMDQALMTEQTVGGSLVFSIRIPAEETVGGLLLLFALRDLGLGLYEIGSGSSIGRGRFRRVNVEIRSDDRSAVLRCEGGAVTVEDPNALIEDWQKAAGGAMG